jgi:hypothetical protein
MRSAKHPDQKKLTIKEEVFAVEERFDENADRITADPPGSSSNMGNEQRIDLDKGQRNEDLTAWVYAFATSNMA